MLHSYYFEKHHLTIIFVISLFIFPGQNIFAQSLVEKVGGVETDFKIYNDTEEMPVIAQVIIKRGYLKKHSIVKTGFENSYGYAYAYGLETFRLEFITTMPLKVPEKIKFKKVKRKYYYIKLTDSDSNIIAIVKTDYDHVSSVTNNNGLYTYSVNLKNVPIILLDKSKRIDLDVIGHYK